MTHEQVPAQVPGFALERLDNETLLYHPAQTRAVHLNEAATLVWALCDGQRSVQAITRLIADAFPANAEAIGRDVEAAVRDLAKAGALTLTSGQ